MCLKYDLRSNHQFAVRSLVLKKHVAYASTLENSVEGDMTKLSLVLDHEIKCCILWSSSMLDERQP